jgi:DNA modification methylase
MGIKMTYTLHHGDCLDVLKTLPDCSVDSIVTDPPYGLSFMGKRWDYDVPAIEIWAECLRVLKPGGHLLAFAGTRTQHRMAVRIEDAGFEIRDLIAWVYGSGFPKSLDVSKAIDKGQGENHARQLQFTAWMRSTGITAEQINEATQSCMASHYLTDKSQPAIATADMFDKLRPYLPEVPEEIERLVCERTGLEWKAYKQREVVGQKTSGIANKSETNRHTIGASSCVVVDITAPATEAAKQWQGWGTALKPALETVTFASKPYTDEQERDIIKSNLFRLEARLWLLSFVSAVEKSSTSSQQEQSAAFAIAQWSAEELTNTRGALCAQMDMSLFELATTTSLSIVSSWRRTLAESWSDGSTSTIETKSSTTIDLKTLKFSLSQITPESIIKACSLTGGFSANATTAENHFNASLSLLQSIHTLSATENVISLEAQSCRDVGVKPNLDPIVLARKPLIGTVAENVMRHGTGGINVDGCRVGGESWGSRTNSPDSKQVYGDYGFIKTEANQLGRWPANFTHDGSEDVTDLLGEAVRFFYCAKASKRDRDEGLKSDVAFSRQGNRPGSPDETGKFPDHDHRERTGNFHPTVKPTDLMRYLCRLVTPPGGIVLDPFTGSGSTGKAAILEGFQFIGIEREAEYIEIARARIEHAQEEKLGMLL